LKIIVQKPNEYYYSKNNWHYHITYYFTNVSIEIFLVALKKLLSAMVRVLTNHFT
jgi:hypothetical protein